MIRLVGRDGFEMLLDPERITAFGLETPVPTLWVRIDGREFSFTENIQEQYKMLQDVTQSDSAKIVGMTP